MLRAVPAMTATSASPAAARTRCPWVFVRSWIVCAPHGGLVATDHDDVSCGSIPISGGSAAARPASLPLRSVPRPCRGREKTVSSIKCAEWRPPSRAHGGVAAGAKLIRVPPLRGAATWRPPSQAHGGCAAGAKLIRVPPLRGAATWRPPSQAHGGCAAGAKLIRVPPLRGANAPSGIRTQDLGIKSPLL